MNSTTRKSIQVGDILCPVIPSETNSCILCGDGPFYASELAHHFESCFDSYCPSTSTDAVHHVPGYTPKHHEMCILCGEGPFFGDELATHFPACFDSFCPSPIVSSTLEEQNKQEYDAFVRTMQALHFHHFQSPDIFSH